MKYTVDRVKEISELYATGKFTIEEICKAVDICPSIFYNWKNNKPEFEQIIKNAEMQRLKSLREMALSSLAKKITGYETKEVHKSKGKIVKTITKEHGPDTTAIIFTLANTYKEEFRRNDQEKTGPTFLPPVREIQDGCDAPEDNSN